MVVLQDIIQLKVEELKDKLTEAGLDNDGNKVELQQRYLNFLIAKEKEDMINQIEKMKEDLERLMQVNGLNQEKPVIEKHNNNSTPKDTLPRKSVKNFDLKKLITPFKGDGDSFDLFSSSIKMILKKYEVDEEDLKLDLISCLEGKARQWFLSRPNNFELTIDQILFELDKLFNTRANRVQQRRNFETRYWKENEDFYAYYTQKMILANSLQLDDEELVDYLIDGIRNRNLQSQARLQMFKSPEDLLNAFSKLTDWDRGFQRREPAKHMFVKSEKQNNKVSTTSAKDFKCYNCGERGHTSPNCKKPKRLFGSCIRCGSTEHKVADCPKPRDPPKDLHMVDEKVADGVSSECTIYFEENPIKNYALIDSGSPINLIKVYLVDEKKIEPVENSNEFRGVNNSLIYCFGVIFANILIFEKLYKIKFHVVSNDTMTVNVLLGRDFLKAAKAELKIDNYAIKFDKSSENNIFNIDADCFEIDLIKDKIDINERLPVEKKNEFLQIVDDCYINSLKPEKPKIKFEMSIELEKNEIVNSLPRRLSYTERGIVSNMIDELIAKNIIQPSNSPYCSPIVLIRKRSKNEYRMCVDYRRLNKITVKDNYPLPVIEDLLDFLYDKKYFSCLDLKSGFHHVNIAPDSVKYTSFVTPLGQFEYLKLPFGLKNGPSVFQRFINKIFCDLIAQHKLIIYIDDIMIATRTIDEHLEILIEVFRLLSENLLELRLSKCQFLYEKIDYLGYTVDEKGISPNYSNIKSIEEYPIPRNLKELQRFLGMCSYFRKFVQDFSLIAKPLQDLVKKECTFEIGEEQINSFNTLKQKMIERPVLAIFSPQDETELHCDASAVGFGSVLLQKKKDGKFHPISYFSKRTTPAESKYHSYELECLAIVYSLRRFRVYLHGRPFKIITDCAALTLTLQKKVINPRIARWVLEMMEFDYVTEHRGGRRMQHVDALSRAQSVLVIVDNPFEQTLAILQSQDPKLENLRKSLEEQESPFYELRDGLIYRKINKNKLRFYVPEAMQTQVVRNSHDLMGHIGLVKTIEVVGRHYWFPEMKSFVKKYIANCLKCIKYNQPSGKVEGYMHSIPKGNKPFDVLHSDFYGPLEMTRSKKRYVLGLVDGFTKYVRLFATKTMNAMETIGYIKIYFQQFGRPNKIITDRGGNYNSHEFSSFMKENNIKHIKVASAAPRANGQYERFNRTLTPMLSKLIDKERKIEWDQVLDTVEFAYNHSINSTTKMTPSMLLFGVNTKGPVNDMLIEYLEEDNRLNNDELPIEELREIAHKNIEKSQDYNEKYVNKSRKDATNYQVGDLVVVKNVDTTPGINKKLIPKYRGPYIIDKVLGNDRFLIKDVDGFQITNKPFEGIYDVTRIKPFMSN